MPEIRMNLIAGVKKKTKKKDELTGIISGVVTPKDKAFEPNPLADPA